MVLYSWAIGSVWLGWEVYHGIWEVYGWVTVLYMMATVFYGQVTGDTPIPICFITYYVAAYYT